MVRTSLIKLVNLRTKDIHWWFNGRKLERNIFKFENIRLRLHKESEDKKMKAIETKPILEELISFAKSSNKDSNQILSSIKKLENKFQIKFDEETSRKLTREQLRLLQTGFANDPEVTRLFKKAIEDWEKPGDRI